MRNQTIVTTYYCRFPVSGREAGSGQNLQPLGRRIEATAGFGNTPTAPGAYLQNCSLHAGQERAWAAVSHEGEDLARWRIYQGTRVSWAPGSRRPPPPGAGSTALTNETCRKFPTDNREEQTDLGKVCLLANAPLTAGR